jgi:hypothetical protein
MRADHVRLHAALLALGLSLSPALGVVIRHDRDDNAYVQLAAGLSVAPRIGTLSVPGALATGTLIAPGWVLTAAHPLDQGVLASQVRFTIGKRQVQASRIVLAPAWTGVFSAGGDVALVQLAEAITAPAYPQLAAQAPAPGATGLWLGAGRTGNGFTGDILASTTLRAFANTIDAVTPAGLLQADFDSPIGPAGAQALDLEGAIAPGDSGGPLLIADGSGGWHIAGVHSHILNQSPRAGYGTTMFSAGVAPLGAWIGATIPAPGAAGALVCAWCVALRRRRGV